MLVEALRILGESAEPNADSIARARQDLLTQWVELAILEGTPQGLDRVLCEVCRMGPRNDFLKQLEALVAAGIALMAGSDRAGALSEAVSPFQNPRLERTRLELCFTAARRMAADKVGALLEEARHWARSSPCPESKAALLGWTGRFCYQEGRFEEAAVLCTQAAAAESWVMARAIALFHAAGAWLEAFCFDEAVACAEEARSLSRSGRNVYHEARSEWLLRTIEYRRETLVQPDLELVEAVALVGVPDLEALMCITEASLLFRLGEQAEAVRLAERARYLWTGMKKRWGARLARCLAMASGAGLLIDEAHMLAHEAFQCPIPGLGIQMLGLLAMGFPTQRQDFGLYAQELAAQIPEVHWNRRIDILSVDEALNALSKDSAANS